MVRARRIPAGTEVSSPRSRQRLTIGPHSRSRQKLASLRIPEAPDAEVTVPRARFLGELLLFFVLITDKRL